MANKVLITALVTGFAMTSGVGAAFAGSHEGHGPGGHKNKMLEMLDTNKDGSISKAEFEAKRSNEFSAADANNDGTVTPAELTAFHEKKMEERKAERQKRMFDRLDTNKDGKVSKEEFEAGGKFERMDKNNDGKITADEMQWKGKRGHGHGGHDKGGPDGDDAAE